MLSKILKSRVFHRQDFNVNGFFQFDMNSYITTIYWQFKSDHIAWEVSKPGKYQSTV